MALTNLWQCLVAAQDFPLWAERHRSLGVVWWKSKDSTTYRGYSQQQPPDAFPWIELQAVVDLVGASHGQDAPYHYVVETDVQDHNQDELHAWYQQEHLPGLAAVPGTVRARRYRRMQGAPLHVACYDLVTPDAMTHEQWLAVRHTDWSSRVRPMFRNTFRTLYTRVEGWSSNA